MSVRSIEVLRQYLRRLCEEAVPPEDAVLLHRFVTARDREAFELLIARHGPMVLGAARRLVDNTADAEDVFQAVFLSLARLATSIRQGRTLPAWLHKTTCRIARKVRKQRLTLVKEPPPEPCETIAPEAQLVWQEVRQALDEELQRLPERLRSPLLLCYLTGLTRDEAARRLGWSLGTLKRRLEEGRKTLRMRLERRGIAAVGLGLAVLTPEALQAAVNKSLLDSCLGLLFSTGAVVPAPIAVLVLSSAGALKGLAMKSILALLVAIALGVGLYAGMGQADPSKKTDASKEAAGPMDGAKIVQQEDPLPVGSTLRFGTSRFRDGIHVNTMAVAPDGKTAFVANDNNFSRVFDLTSGREVFSLNLGNMDGGVFSPDGRTLVVKQGFALSVRDAVTGKELRTIQGPRSSSGGRELLEFTPNGKAIAMTSRRKIVHLIDFETGKTIREFAHDNPESALANEFSQILAIAFSADGKRMASGGYANDKGNYFARLWDVETGKELRRFMHGKEGYGVGSLTFSPDGKTLATLGTQGGVFLRLFDVDTGKELKAFAKEGNHRPSRGSVAFAPDGKTVAAACGSIRLYDVTTGEERLCIDRAASNLQFTDGGKTLTGAVSGAIYRWDTATGKTLTPEAGDSVVEQILVTSDGSRVVTRTQDGNAHLWDGATGKHLRRLPVAYPSGLAISPDDRFLAWPVSDEGVRFTDPKTPGTIYFGSRIRLYDLAAEKFVDRFPSFKGAAHDLAFTSDGKSLVTVEGHGGLVRIWDFEAGKEVRNFTVLPDALQKQSYVVCLTQVSPNGKTVVVTYEEDLGLGLGGLRGPPQHVRLWDVAGGTELPEFRGGHPLDKAFSPDGRLVVTADGNFVCAVATGERVATLPEASHILAAAFSRDGRFMATAVPGGEIQVWETATWTKRLEFKGHRDQPTTLAFGPGELLFSGSQDTTVLAWDIRPPRVADSVSLQSAWNNLAAKDARESFQSEGKFLAKPAEAVKFFAEKIKPAQALDPKRIQRLLTDLGSDQFAVREAASKALHALDEQAMPYLEKALASAASLEFSVRAKRILEQKQGAALASEQLRRIRAVMVLERIGDGEAKGLLRRWTSGPVGARLTMEAFAALERLEGASKGKR